MARKPRIDFPGAFHHVYGRGIEKRDIFLDDRDRQEFLRRVGINLKRWDVSCIAWAIMPNHFHLLVRSGKGNLPFYMRCLLTGYSMYFNERYERVGHLFQNRYKSRIILRDSHMRAAVRYIHLNPLRGKQVESMRGLDRYPWTGHMQILWGGIAEWQDLPAMGEFFHGPDESDWVRSYREFIESGSAIVEPAIETERMGGSFPSERENVSGFRGDSRMHAKFLEVLSAVSMRCGVPADRIMGGERGYSEVDARRQVLQECKAVMGISAAQVCRWLGISADAGGYLLRTGRKKTGGRLTGNETS